MTKRVLILLAVLCSMLPLGAQDPAQSQQDSSQQQKSNDKKKPKPAQQQPADDQSKPKPLFGGSVSAKSSSQKKDTTSLGFNGLDPQGKVETALLNSSPTSKDEAAVQKLTDSKVDPAELKQFIDEGQLKSTGKGGGQ